MMKNLIHKIQIALLSAILLISNTSDLLAQGGGPNPGPGGGGPNPPDTKLVNPLRFDSIPALLAALLDLVVMVAVPIAILFLIYSGFLFVSARGSEEKLKKAKSVLLYTVIGIALIVGAALIANVIEGTITQLQGN